MRCWPLMNGKNRYFKGGRNMSDERGYTMRVEGRFTIKSREWIDGDFERVELVLQEEINKALRIVNSRFKCEIDVDEIEHSLNFGYKKGVWNNAK